MHHLTALARLLQRATRGRDVRNLIIGGTLLSDVVSWPLLAAAPDGVAVAVTPVAVATVPVALAAGVVALVRRSLSDAGCAALLVVLTAVATVQVLHYESVNVRWACAVGFISMPLLTLMMSQLRWIVVSAATSAAAQLVLLASIPATPVETAFAVAIVCVVLPLNLGNATVLMRSSRRMRARAEHAASVDDLTGLLNRRALRGRWPALLSRAGSGGGCPGLLLVDLDHFKSVNDTHGHDAGDAVLVALAEQLARCAGRGALVTRLGGEEFAVVDSFPDVEAAVRTAEQLRLAASALRAGQQAHGITLSVGVAVAPAGAGSAGPVGPEAAGALLSDLLTRADAALYRAKALGRDRVELDVPGGAAVAG